MGLNVVRSISLLWIAVMLGAGLAHLLALPNKIHPSREDCLTCCGAVAPVAGLLLLGVGLPRRRRSGAT